MMRLVKFFEKLGKLIDYLDRRYMNYIMEGHADDCKCDYHKDR